jgi:hypothetical protein
MSDRFQSIRDALAMGPTPGPRRAIEQSVIGPHDLRILSANVTWSVGVNGSHSVQIEEAFANAALAAACDPDTIRELLAERDALTAEVERLAEALRLIESAKDRGFGIDYARGVAQSAMLRD